MTNKICDSHDKNVYLYIDLTLDKRIPFYVGKGLVGRCKEWRRNNKHDGIIKRHGLFRIVIKCENNDDALYKEKFMIHELRTHFYRDNLTQQEKEYACNFSVGGEKSAEGYKHTDEWKRNRSENQKGRKRDPKAIQKTADSNRGKVRTEEQRSHMRKPKSTTEKMKGPKTPEHIENNRLAQLGKIQSEETKQKRYKGVYKFDLLTGEILNTYKSINQASIQNNINGYAICQCCKGELQNVGTFGWKYINEKDNTPKREMSDEDRQNLTNKLSLAHKKGVIKIDKNGIKLDEYNSIQEAEEENNVAFISMCCLRKVNYAGKWIWRYKSENLTPEQLINEANVIKQEILKKKKKKVKYRSIERISLEDNSTIIFENIQKASQASNVTITSIYWCCRGKSPSAHGFIWRYVIE